MRSKRKAAIACLNNIHDSLRTLTDDEDIVTISSSYVQISEEVSTESCGSSISVNDKQYISDIDNEVNKSSVQFDNKKLNNEKTVANISNVDLKICFNAIQSAAFLMRARETHINSGFELLKTNFRKYLDDFNYLKQSAYWADKILIETDIKSTIFDLLTEGFFPTKEFLMDISKTGKKLAILGSLCSLNVAVSPENQLKHDSLPPLSSMLVSNPVIDQHGAFINCGTYINRMCWAPINAELHQDQFLAVAVYRELTDRTNMYNSKVQADQMVQFYNCGKLLMKTREASLPKLEMVLTHNWGNITDMSWSPQPLPAVSRSQKLIGHLALCCTDGFIRIIPISKQNSGGLVTLINNQPILCLGAIRNKGRVLFPTTMHWRQQFPDKIVAGYNTGHVAIFILESSVFSSHSSILEGNIYLKPSLFRIVFDAPCRSVQICPYNWRLVSCSSTLVSHTVIVDFDQPRERNLPSSVDVEGTIGSRLIWPTPGDVIILGSSKHINNTPGLYLCSVQKPAKRSKKMILHNMSSINLCPSLNILPIGTRSGQVRIFSLNTNSINQLLRARSDCTKSRDAPIASKFYFQYHLTAKEPITRTQSIKTEYGTILPTSSCCACPPILQCVHKLISKFSISITKTEYNEPNDWQLDAMLNVHEIAANPNPGSSTWIAVALECGLIHIVPITHLYRSDLDKMSTGSGCNILEKFSKKLTDESLLVKSLVCLSKIGRRRKYPPGTNYNTLYRQMGKVYSKNKSNANNSDLNMAPKRLNKSMTNIDRKSVNLSTRSMKTKSSFITDYFDDSAIQRTRKRELNTKRKDHLNKSKNKNRPENSGFNKSINDKSLSKSMKTVSKEAFTVNRMRLRSSGSNELLSPPKVVGRTRTPNVVTRKKLRLIDSINNNIESGTSSLKPKSESSKRKSVPTAKKERVMKTQINFSPIVKFLPNASNKNDHSTPKNKMCVLPKSFISPIISPNKKKLRSYSSTNEETRLEEINVSSFDELPPSTVVTRSRAMSNSSLGSREKNQPLSPKWNLRSFHTEESNKEDQGSCENVKLSFTKVNKNSSNQVPISNCTRSGRSFSNSLEKNCTVHTKWEPSGNPKSDADCSKDSTGDERNSKMENKSLELSEKVLQSRVTRSRLISDISVGPIEKDSPKVCEMRIFEKGCVIKEKGTMTVPGEKNDSNLNDDLSTSRVTRSRLISNSSVKNHTSLVDESTNNLKLDCKASLEFVGNKRTPRKSAEPVLDIKDNSLNELSISRVTRSSLSPDRLNITTDAGERKLQINLRKISGVLPEANPRKTVEKSEEKSNKRKPVANEQEIQSKVKKAKINNSNVSSLRADSLTDIKKRKQSKTRKKTERPSLSLSNAKNQTSSNANESYTDRTIKPNEKEIPHNVGDLSTSINDISPKSSPEKLTSQTKLYLRSFSVGKEAVTNESLGTEIRVSESMCHSFVAEATEIPVANVSSDFQVNISTKTSAIENSFAIEHSHEKGPKRIPEYRGREESNEDSKMIAKPLVKKKDNGTSSIKSGKSPSLEDTASSTKVLNMSQSANLKYRPNFFCSTKRVLKTDIDDEDPEVDLNSLSMSIMSRNWNVSNSSSRSAVQCSPSFDSTFDFERSKNSLELSTITNNGKLKTWNNVDCDKSIKSVNNSTKPFDTSDKLLTQIKDFAAPTVPEKSIKPDEEFDTHLNKLSVLPRTRSQSRSRTLENRNSCLDFVKSVNLIHNTTNVSVNNASQKLITLNGTAGQPEPQTNSDQLPNFTSHHNTPIVLVENIDISTNSQKSTKSITDKDILKNVSVSIVPIEFEKSLSSYLPINKTKKLTNLTGSSENVPSTLYGAETDPKEHGSFVVPEKTVHSPETTAINSQSSPSVQLTRFPLSSKDREQPITEGMRKPEYAFANNPISHSTPKFIKTSDESFADGWKRKAQSKSNKDKKSSCQDVSSIKKSVSKKSKAEITNSDRLKRLHDVLSMKRLELFSSQSVQVIDDPDVVRSSSKCSSSWWGADRFREMKDDTDADLNKIDDISLVISSPKKTLISNSSVDDHMNKIKKVICLGLSLSEVERNSVDVDCPELLQPFRSLKASKNQNFSQPDNS